MFDRFTIKARKEQIDELRRRYRLHGKTDDDVAQTVFDEMLRTRNFHLAQNRTENNSSEPKREG